LEILAFEKQPRTGHTVKIGAGQDRCLMDIWPHASLCRQHIVKGWNHCSVGIITPAPHMRPYYSL